MKAKSYDTDERFVFSDGAKKSVFTILGIGLVFFVIGILSLAFGSESGGAEHALAGLEEGGGEHAGSHAYHWTTRIKVNLWINNIFFLGLSIIGVFFFSIQYAAHAGWSAGIKRIPEAFGSFLPVAFVLMIAVFAFSYHEIFHWTDGNLFDKKHEDYDEIIAGKQAFLNMPFYVGRMFLFITVWYLFYRAMRKQSLLEDIEGGTKRFWKMKTLATLFIIFFAISSSVAAWDWVMSIDTHWFSTMFGWYVFASWHVSGLAAISLALVFLKEAGYLKFMTESHFHDINKLIFGFSIFWAYIWFGQFILIYYANIPEETIYFVERLESDHYSKFIFFNLFINFFFPFLAFMTRDAKRKMTIIKIVCIAVLIGHWFDFYLMITPGTLKEHGGLGFLEVGLTMMYLAIFIYVVANELSKAPLIAKNHPMLQESLHHNI